jgi:hypothetical protein
VSTDDRPSLAQRADTYAAWRNRLSQQSEEAKVIDLAAEERTEDPADASLDWSTDALFAESRRVADEESAGA